MNVAHNPVAQSIAVSPVLDISLEAERGRCNVMVLLHDIRCPAFNVQRPAQPRSCTASPPRYRIQYGLLRYNHLLEKLIEYRMYGRTCLR